MIRVLAFCYFLAFVAAMLKGVRYWMDYKRTGHRYYLIGIPANIGLAVGCALIVVASGPDPLWSGPQLTIAIRTAIILWALLSFCFELLYARTYLIVRTPEEPIDAHGD